jgi:molecular chaperone GrpE
MSDEEQKPNTIDELADHSSADSTVDAREASLQEALATKVEECKALNEKYLRLAAEFENYKRLSQRDQRDQIRYGNEQILKELLPVVDNLERAIKAAKESSGGDALIQGVELTLKQLTSTLAKFGVSAIETVGHPFDPTAHQAVSQGPSMTVPERHVAEEFQKGYRLHDRVLRAAMVGVSTGLPASDATIEQDRATPER